MDSQHRDTLDPEFASLLLDSMADGVFTLDQDGRITTWNRSMERITGYTAEEARGQRCTLLNFNRCFARRCPAGIWECGIYKHGAIDSSECFLRNKQGLDVPVVKSARLVKDENGSVKGVVETVTDLTELREARQRAEEAARRLGEFNRLENIIGRSTAMQDVFSSIRAAAESEATVLLQGESGTGKELVAGAIHFNSDRRHGPFIPVNCSALPESLLESELFGHAKGAFTGALRSRKGRFEEADGGTIFLDEVADITPYVQVRLLRVLQEREIERVGESLKRPIDIRVIAATNKDLYHMVQRGEFREDLFYRLKVFPIQLPPLRERKEDIPLLISHFVEEQNRKTGKEIRGFSHSAMRILMDYPFPGNVRELENAVEHAFVLCSGDTADLFDLPMEIRRLAYRPAPPEARSSPDPAATPRGAVSRESLLELLEACNWNKAEVGRVLGKSRTAVWKHMKKWNIPMKRPKEIDAGLEGREVL
ncbi:MAG: sigma-54 interaction domain-containing protein [Desulfobacteraceae bacterium]